VVVLSADTIHVREQRTTNATEDSPMKRFCLAWLACLVCLAPLPAQTPEIQAKTSTVLFVQKLQTKEGGFLSEPADPTGGKAQKPTLRATSSAIRALKYLGGALPDKQACVKFVASCFDKSSGGFADVPGGKVDIFTTSVGLMAVAELGMPAEPYYAACIKYLADNVKTFEEIRIAVAGLERIKAESPKKKEWTETVSKEKVPAKGEEDAGRARILASKLVTLMRLDPTSDVTKAPAVLEFIGERLRAGQRASGGYGKDAGLKADLESTYRVMRAFMMLKQKPASVADMLNFIAKCRNNDGGYGVAPGQPSSVGGTYFAAIITHWLEDNK
jgi:prenyltransferase beta subunit